MLLINFILQDGYMLYLISCLCLGRVKYEIKEDSNEICIQTRALLGFYLGFFASVDKLKSLTGLINDNLEKNFILFI